jgi:hypothetical protein
VRIAFREIKVVHSVKTGGSFEDLTDIRVFFRRAEGIFGALDEAREELPLGQFLFHISNMIAPLPVFS